MAQLATETIRVASVPSGHPYVRNLGASGGKVDRLPDPLGPDGRWWPPRMLEPGWVAEHETDFDLMHVHFGFDGLAPETITAVCDSLDHAGKPLVYTAHDLENPHHGEQSLHLAQMAVLMERSAAVATLTPGARDVISRLFGREATVIPHPHIFPLDELPDERRREPGAPLVVALHYKSLRENMIGPPILEATVAGAESFGPERVAVRVDVHRDVWDRPGPGTPAELVRRLAVLSRSGRIDLRVHDYFDEEEFRRYIGEIDASVLPYAFGSHSGWLEACRDLGTAVIAPDLGFYSGQGTVFEYRVRDHVPDPESVRKAIGRAMRSIESGELEPVGRRSRRAQRERIGRAHLELYRGVL